MPSLSLCPPDDDAGDACSPVEDGDGTTRLPYHGIMVARNICQTIKMANIRCIMVAIKYFELTRGS